MSETAGLAAPQRVFLHDEDLAKISDQLAGMPAALRIALPGVHVSAAEMSQAFSEAALWRTSRPPPDPLRLAAKGVAPHIGAWIALLDQHVRSLPVDLAGGECDAARSYAEHELRAMRRDLGALAEALVVTA